MELTKRISQLFFDPKAFFKREKKLSDMKVALYFSAGYYGVLALLLGIFYGVMSIASGDLEFAFIALLIGIAGVIFYPIFGILGNFIFAGVHYLCMRIFTKKGNFTEMFYLSSVGYLPLYGILSIPIAVVSAILTPILPIFSGVIQVVFGLGLLVYMLVVLTWMLKEIGKLTTGQAVIVWIIPMGIYMLFIGLIFLSVLALTALSFL